MCVRLNGCEDAVGCTEARYGRRNLKDAIIERVRVQVEQCDSLSNTSGFMQYVVCKISLLQTVVLHGTLEPISICPHNRAQMSHVRSHHMIVQGSTLILQMLVQVLLSLWLSGWWARCGHRRRSKDALRKSTSLWDQLASVTTDTQRSSRTLQCRALAELVA